MILKPDEIAFLDAYCFEGTEPPFGGAATDVMASIGVHDGDTLNIQWAYLLDKPPSGPVIGNASTVAPPLPWPNREAVLRRDKEIRAIREETQKKYLEARAAMGSRHAYERVLAKVPATDPVAGDVRRQ